MSFSMKQHSGLTISSLVHTTEGDSISASIEDSTSNLQENKGKYLYHPYEDVQVKQLATRVHIPKLEERIFTKPTYQKEEIIYDKIQEKWIVIKSTDTYKKF